MYLKQPEYTFLPSIDYLTYRRAQQRQLQEYLEEYRTSFWLPLCRKAERYSYQYHCRLTRLGDFPGYSVQFCFLTRVRGQLSTDMNVRKLIFCLSITERMCRPEFWVRYLNLDIPHNQSAISRSQMNGHSAR